jgi:hypothetical protein
MKQEKEEEAAAAKEEEVRKKREDAKLAEREEREAQIYRVRLRCSLDAINRMARQTNRNDNVKKTARAGVGPAVRKKYYAQLDDARNLGPYRYVPRTAQPNPNPKPRPMTAVPAKIYSTISDLRPKTAQNGDRFRARLGVSDTHGRKTNAWGGAERDSAGRDEGSTARTK